MPRIARVYVETPFFHIIVQGLNKSYIFDLDEDKQKYINLMKKYEKKYNVKVIAYCIMSNHAHLLIETDNIKEMSKFMHDLNAVYASSYNKRNARIGYVYRDRYKAEGIYTEEYLTNCIMYIHNNPVKSKMVKKPCEYRYSSYNEYLNNREIMIGKFFTGNIRKFETMHKEEYNEDFLDIENDIMESIEIFEKQNKIQLGKILKNKNILRELTIELKNRGFSYREIEKAINISRETLRRLAM